MYALNADSKKSIFEATGMTVEQIIDMDFDDIDARIGKKIGHKITGYIIDDALASRGQVYSQIDRFINMDEVDKGLSEHDRRKSAFIRKSVPAI